MIVYLSYHTPSRLCKRKKCESVEQARKIGQKLRKKDGYIVSSYSAITSYEVINGVSVGKLHDLYEEGQEEDKNAERV